MMKHKEYLEARNNRIRQYLRLRLVIWQILNNPVLCIILILPVISLIYLIKNKDFILSQLKIPELVYPLINYIVNILIILLPIIFLLYLIETIGNLIAHRDEVNLKIAFSKQELRNGCPILMNKKKVKGTSVIVREFHSNIPLNTWKENKDRIADSLNVRFVEPIIYGGNGNGKRILITTVKGRTLKEREDLYDEEF